MAHRPLPADTLDGYRDIAKRVGTTVVPGTWFIDLINHIRALEGPVLEYRRELDALPRGAVVRDRDGTVAERIHDDEINDWFAVGTEDAWPPVLPVTVLHWGRQP